MSPDVFAAGNPILLQLHDSLRDRQRRMMLAALARDADRLQQVLDEHRALADAVMAGAAEVARQVLASTSTARSRCSQRVEDA